VVGSGSMHALGQILSKQFLERKFGVQGLYYDQDSETFVKNVFERDLNVVDTTVKIIGDTSRPRA